MAWKLKKSKTTEGGEVDDASIVSEDSAVEFPGFSPTDSVSAQAADDSDNDFLTTRMMEVDDAISSLNSAKANPPAQRADATATNGASSSSEEDDWSLDAFAPYKPADKMQVGHVPDFDAGADDAVVDFTPASHVGNGVSAGDTTDFGMFDPSAAADDDFETLDFSGETSSTLDDSDWQLGEAGEAQTADMNGTAVPSSEPRMMDAAEMQSHVLTNGHSLSKVEQEEDDEDILQASLLSPASPTPESTDFDDSAVAPPTEIPHGVVTDLPPSISTESVVPVAAHPPIAAPSSVGTPQLIIRLGAFSATYDVGATEMIIGRPDPNTGLAPDISVEWDDAISRHHAQVFRQSDKFYVEDMDSKNGTLLNGQRLPASTPVQLSTGDKIRVGERTEITFHI